MLYFARVNSRVEFGGLFQYSKFDIIKHLPEEHVSRSHYFSRRPEDAQFWKGKVNLPFIYKPNYGERGKRVTLFRSEKEFEAFYPSIKEDFIIQEYCDYPIELGVLCHKGPEEKLKITSIVLKEFLAITGDGRSSLEELISKKKRALNRFDYFLEKFDSRRAEVLEEGEILVLEEIGNHCRGTKFMDGSHLINSDLEEVFDGIMESIPDFHYGRFDLKVKSMEDLYSGKNICIFELNGINSEAAHIYDPKHTLGYAYRTVFKEFRTVYRLSKSLKRRGVTYPPQTLKFFQAIYHQVFGRKSIV